MAVHEPRLFKVAPSALTISMAYDGRMWWSISAAAGYSTPGGDHRWSTERYDHLSWDEAGDVVVALLACPPAEGEPSRAT